MNEWDRQTRRIEMAQAIMGGLLIGMLAAPFIVLIALLIKVL